MTDGRPPLHREVEVRAFDVDGNPVPIPPITDRIRPAAVSKRKGEKPVSAVRCPLRHKLAFVYADPEGGYVVDVAGTDHDPEKLLDGAPGIPMRGPGEPVETIAAGCVCGVELIDVRSLWDEVHVRGTRNVRVAAVRVSHGAQG